MSYCTCDYHQEQNKKRQLGDECCVCFGEKVFDDGIVHCDCKCHKSSEEKKDWLKESDKELSGDVDWAIGAAHEEYCLTSDNCNCLTLYDRLNDLIREKLKEEREALIQEIVTLSDKIEGENSTEFNEWRAFKGFRNTLRDKYLNK